MSSKYYLPPCILNLYSTPGVNPDIVTKPSAFEGVSIQSLITLSIYTPESLPVEVTPVEANNKLVPSVIINYD